MKKKKNLEGDTVLWTIICQALCSENKAGEYGLVEHVILFLLNLLDEQHRFDVSLIDTKFDICISVV